MNILDTSSAGGGVFHIHASTIVVIHRRGFFDYLTPLKFLYIVIIVFIRSYLMVYNRTAKATNNPPVRSEGFLVPNENNL
jgi:hypothetical protein